MHDGYGYFGVGRRLDPPRLWGPWRIEGTLAFTLVELLTLIAIVIILGALILAGASRAKSMVHSVTCLSNLRQWGMATQLYAAENDDYLPREGSPNALSRHDGWYVLLPRAMGQATYHQQTWRTNADAFLPRSLWICPANTNRSNGHNLFHYCLNEHIDGTGQEDQARRLSAIGCPSVAVWLFDNGKRAAVAQQNNVHTNVHRGGAQFLFLDSHAARFPNRDYWDFRLNRGRTNHPGLVWKP